MNMNSEEIKGLQDILRTLETADLFSVLDTTTNHMVVAENRKEAIHIILTCTKNASTLLHRRKITKQVIFNYLLDHGIGMTTNSEKPACIKACLKYWKSNEDVQAEDMDEKGTMEIIDRSSSEVSSPNFGQMFCVWFFERLNKQEDFGSHHFWVDCTFNLKVKVPTEVQEFHFIGASEVVQQLTQCVVSRQIFFNPNDAENAVKTETDNHGLVKVNISGVLHQLNNCIGMFDASFGLVRDPMHQNSWKIKILYLMMQMNSAPESNMLT